MRRSLRAAWRLLRCVVHAFRGLAIVWFRFGSMDLEQRRECIGAWSGALLRQMGIAMRVDGEPHRGGTLVVANHISWLDITALHAVLPHARFVAKADIRHWPLISRLADSAQTLYLERERKRDALRVVHLVAEALHAGQTVAVFPEGTTSDGRAVLPFHANLMQAAISTGTPIQPVALRFSDATDAISRAVEFVGATTLAQSLWAVACGDGLVVHIQLLEPVSGAGVDRRELAGELRRRIETAMQPGPG